MRALLVLALCAALGPASPAHGRTLLQEADVETPAWHQADDFPVCIASDTASATECDGFDNDTAMRLAGSISRLFNYLQSQGNSGPSRGPSSDSDLQSEIAEAVAECACSELPESLLELASLATRPTYDAAGNTVVLGGSGGGGSTTSGRPDGRPADVSGTGGTAEPGSTTSGRPDGRPADVSGTGGTAEPGSTTTDRPSERPGGGDANTASVCDALAAYFSKDDTASESSCEERLEKARAAREEYGRRDTERRECLANCRGAPSLEEIPQNFEMTQGQAAEGIAGFKEGVVEAVMQVGGCSRPCRDGLAGAVEACSARGGGDGANTRMMFDRVTQDVPARCAARAGQSSPLCNGQDPSAMRERLQSLREKLAADGASGEEAEAELAAVTEEMRAAAEACGERPAPAPAPAAARVDGAMSIRTSEGFDKDRALRQKFARAVKMAATHLDGPGDVSVTVNSVTLIEERRRLLQDRVSYNVDYSAFIGVPESVTAAEAEVTAAQVAEILSDLSQVEATMSEVGLSMQLLQVKAQVVPMDVDTGPGGDTARAEVDDANNDATAAVDVANNDATAAVDVAAVADQDAADGDAPPPSDALELGGGGAEDLEDGATSDAGPARAAMAAAGATAAALALALALL
eukprot:CAMPEP_0182865256 /NCGR_PEP_ID=MMETSP0034_2-20130328/7594_1 /TAXON_ID=156128 /ORGANISM="Nephroselmis pyriformis, Strain CCMP717" /LENGTH=636 /DNA_ID=CAMNT_0024997549 /DNA_START=1 /DNA_END=1911 /DNA_ORIENTATION=+